MSGRHVDEAVMDWQYGLVHWLALAEELVPEKAPPAGEGWELNTDIGDGGHVVKVPTWSDGSIVQHRVYWRRSSPGMRHWMPAAFVRECRRPWWIGSKVPDRILRSQGKTMG